MDRTILNQENMRGQSWTMKTLARICRCPGVCFPRRPHRLIQPRSEVFSEKVNFNGGFVVRTRHTNIFGEDTRSYCFSKVYKRYLLAGYAKN